jgi:tRNA A-37 threonylcarbamoyl transferase component Bud32
MSAFDKEIYNRMARIESKLVRGFEELGVNITTTPDWLTVDDAQRTVYIPSLGRSLMVILTDMARRGATQVGKEYTLVHRGESVGTLIFNPVV